LDIAFNFIKRVCIAHINTSMAQINVRIDNWQTVV